MSRRIGTGLLVVGACSACWIAPLLVGLAGAGWLGARGVSWPVIAGIGVLGAAALVVGRRLRQRRRPAACACPPV